MYIDKPSLLCFTKITKRLRIAAAEIHLKTIQRLTISTAMDITVKGGVISSRERAGSITRREWRDRINAAAFTQVGLSLKYLNAMVGLIIVFNKTMIPMLVIRRGIRNCRNQSKLRRVNPTVEIESFSSERLAGMIF